MKNKQFMVMICIISCLLIGCNTYPNQEADAKNNVTTTPIPETTIAPVAEYNNIQVSTELSVEVNAINLSNCRMEVTIKNNSDTQIYSFPTGGAGVEQQVDGHWQELDIIYEAPRYDGSQGVRPGDTIEYYAFWSDLYGALPSGDYRLIIRELSSEGNDIYIYFTLPYIPAHS